MRSLSAAMGLGLLAAPLAAHPDAATLAGVAEVLAAQDWESMPPPAALLGLPLPYQRPAEQPALRGEARPRPAVPPMWSASVLSYSANMMGMNFTGGEGSYYYDRIGQRDRTKYIVTTDYFRPNYTRPQDITTRNISDGRNMTFGEGKDGTCIKFGHMWGYNDMFGWVEMAKYTGSRTASGGPCDVWRAEVNASGMVGFTEACFGADGVPREFHMEFGHDGKFSMHQYLTYSHAKVGHLDEEVFAPTYACAQNYPSAPCDGDGVKQLEVFRIFGPPEPLTLSNRNAGDDLGDLSFACTQASGPFYRNKAITWWTVEVDTRFGQYALCNYNGTDNNCVSGSRSLVGRRSGQMGGESPLLGQCAANDDVGSQYSFPVDGMCPEGVHPGPAAGCSWGFATARRTISADCVLGERGLLEACASEIGHAPFLKAQRIFRAAFESDDPSKGGCPDALQSQEVQILV